MEYWTFINNKGVVEMKKNLVKNKLLGISCLLAVGLFSGAVVGNMFINSGTTEISHSVVNHDLGSLVERADVIINASVSDVSEFQSNRDEIYRTQTITVVVEDVFKGGVMVNNPLTIEVNSYKNIDGVTIGDSDISDPNFEEDTDVLLFLVENDKGTYYVAGINQGLLYPNTNTKAQETLYQYDQIIGNDVVPFTQEDLVNIIK